MEPQRYIDLIGGLAATLALLSTVLLVIERVKKELNSESSDFTHVQSAVSSHATSKLTNLSSLVPGHRPESGQSEGGTSGRLSKLSSFVPQLDHRLSFLSSL